MKHLLCIAIMLLIVPTVIQAQEYDPQKTYIVTKNDGTRFIGQIVSSDARELLIRTSEMGEIIIPKHEIKSIVEFQAGDDKYKELFATRYYLTTNGLPVEKGDSYIQWTLVGPDVHFGVSDDLSIGVLTTWVASPVVLSVKKNGKLGPKTWFAVGALAGTPIWNLGEFFVALPYAALTYGNENANISASAGIGYVATKGYDGSQSLYSLSGMKKITRSGTLVFESLILPFDGETVAILVPGFRLQTQEKSAFQFGFPGVYYSGRSTPLGFPMVTWFRKL